MVGNVSLCDSRVSSTPPGFLSYRSVMGPLIVLQSYKLYNSCLVTVILQAFKTLKCYNEDMGHGSQSVCVRPPHL